MREESMSVSRHSGSVMRWTLSLCTLAFLGFIGFQHVFSTFADYDDEGYVMISLRSFVDGKPLYDETFSQYGPGYYFAQSLLHGNGQLPISHDVTRVKTLITWIAVAWLAYLFLWRVTRSRPVALCGLWATFLHLDRLALEPGHPQEFVAIGIAVTLWLSSQFQFDHIQFDGRLKPRKLLASRNNQIVLASLAFLVAWLALTKLNVGVFLVISLALFVCLSVQSRHSKLVFYVFGLLAVLFPFVLHRDVLLEPNGFQLPLSVSLTIAITCLAASKQDWKQFVSIRQVLVALIVSAICGILLLVGTLAQGTSVKGLVHGLVGQHLGFSDNFYHGISIWNWALVAIAAIIVGLWTCSVGSKKERSTRFLSSARLILLVCLGASVLSYVIESTQPLVHGLASRGNVEGLLAVMPLIASVLFFSQRGFGDHVPRLVLCLVAPVQTLAAYPTPGTQLAVGSYAIVLAALIAAHDFWLALKANSSRTQELNRSWLRVIERAPKFAVGLLVMTLIFRAACSFQYRSQLDSLDLPGARLLRLPSDEARQYQQLVGELNACSSTFVFAEHGVNSIYLWAKCPPPTSANATFWPYLLSNAEQQEIEEVLRKQAPKVAAIRHPSLRESIRSSPLRTFIDKNFSHHRTIGNLEIWKPRESTVPQ